ncbi:eukaryotic aspartyl protease-like protein 5 [Elsinoe australis]|uniref:Eukaryotic aspartyl protease-like protein 5 n=1 Tax=Elsinoe australis TaxID=40998 RepID=A0A4U7AR85_9PEZI|nr:eukaryotic aspartyl protease-like protein 5 [Elsinoe australis]
MAASPWTALLVLLFGLAVCARSLDVRATANTLTPVDGIDGSWSSFTVGVGTPPQYSRVFASWQGYQTWVIDPRGCQSGDTSCIDRRGGVFNMNKSSTWDQVGLYGLAIQQNLGFGGNAFFGYDKVVLGGDGQEGPTLENSTVGDLAVNDYYLGVLGLNPKPTNWTTFSNGAPSLITQLKQRGQIPSVSFGYTAGAPYRFTRVPASLTLGGYDTSRFEANDIQFTLGADNSRDTMIAVQAITTTKQGSSDVVQLLPEPIYALVDATFAEIWLPLSACQAFEQEFGLIYNNDTKLYLVNSTLHRDLLARDATVSFTIGLGTSGGPTTTIDFPYAAFDLTARPPFSNMSSESTYFPLRRAQNDTQYTLGRTFMQEAYISVDYERAKFNVSKVVWQQDAPASLVAISPTPSGAARTTGTFTSTETGSEGNFGLGSGAIGGIVAGVVIVIAAIVGFLLWRRRKRRTAVSLQRHDSSKSAGLSSSGDTVITDARPYFAPKAELEGNSNDSDIKLKHKTSTLGGSTVYSPTTPSPGHAPVSPGAWAGEKDGTAIYEMMGDLPDTNLADSKQITEKDMMRHREKQYNGYDPVEEQKRQELDRIKDQERQRKAKIDATQIREATEEEGGNRRFSFIQGQDTLSPTSPSRRTGVSAMDSQGSGSQGSNTLSPVSPRTATYGTGSSASGTLSPVSPGTSSQ